VNDVDALGINKQRNPVIDRKKKETACKKKQRNEETGSSRGLSNYLVFRPIKSSLFKNYPIFLALIV